MLSIFVGSVDSNSAVVLAVAFACICVIVTTFIVAVSKRKNSKIIDNEFELARLRQAAEDERSRFALETDRSYKIKQLDQNLITSHVRE
jgi:hypothetical protein